MAVFYIGIEPASNPGEGTTLSIVEYTLEPALLYKVRHLERFPIGTEYPTIIEEVNQIRAELKGGAVVLNTTFIGDPTVDMFKQEGRSPISIFISGGETAIKPHVENAVDPIRKYDHLSWNVPLKDLISILQVCLQKGQLIIAPDLELAQALIDEILNFRVEISPSGKIDKSTLKNADLLLSVSIACYVAARFGGTAIPIENLTTESTGIPEMLQDADTKMPVVWDSGQTTTQQWSARLKYAWAQPARGVIQGGNNLPGLM